MKTKVAFAAAVILAIAAGIGAKSVLDSFKRRALSTENRVTLIVARGNLRGGEFLTEDKFDLKKVPAETAKVEYLTYERLAQVEGRQLVNSVRDGAPLTLNDFVKPASQMDFTEQVPMGYRALTIPVDQVAGVSGLIKPRDRVDVLATLVYHAPDARGTKSMLETMTVLRNISVLAIDDRTAEHAAIPLRYRRGGRDDYTSVTLSVTPTEARIVTLARAQSQGMLTLVLRNPADRLPNDMGRTNADDLWQTIQEAAKKRAPHADLSTRNIGTP